MNDANSLNIYSSYLYLYNNSKVKIIIFVINCSTLLKSLTIIIIYDTSRLVNFNKMLLFCNKAFYWLTNYFIL